MGVVRTTGRQRRQYSKQSVQTRTDRGYGGYRPCVNVKAYSWPSDLAYMIWKEWPHVNLGHAAKVAEWAWEMAISCFWDEWNTAEAMPRDYFPRHTVRIVCEGRSGGWLVVDGLPEVEEWDAVDLAYWRSFENDVRASVKHRCSWDQIKADIEANEWHRGGYQYNFMTLPSGENVCRVDWPYTIAAPVHAET